MATNREFKVGETVHLGMRVSDPITRQPITATVTLDVLQRTSVTPPVSHLPADVAFTTLTQGDYAYTIRTVDLTPGVYKVVIRIVDPAAPTTKVVLHSDEFVLAAL